MKYLAIFVGLNMWWVNRVQRTEVPIVETQIETQKLAAIKVTPEIEEKNYELGDKFYTLTEYKIEAVKLTDKMKNRKIKLLTFQDKREWERLLKRCGKVTLTNVTELNIIDKLNDNIISCIEKL